VNKILMLALTAFFLIQSVSSRAEVYSNEKYGFFIPIPKGLTVCPYGQPESIINNHGAAILLQGNSDDCQNLSSLPSIGLWADWDAYEAKTVKDATAIFCTPPKVGTITITRRFHIGSLRSLTCELHFSDGWVNIRVDALSKVLHSDGIPLEHYSISLYTFPNRVAKDIVILKKVLKTFKLCIPDKDCPEAP